jgi:hypothetical protein
MKVLNLALLLFLFAGGVFAQSGTTDAPDVKVLESSWRRKVGRLKIVEDPLGPSVNQVKEERDLRYASGREGAIRDIYTRSASTSRPRREAIIQTTRALQRIFKTTLVNTGSKHIKRLVWEYVFFDRASGTEIDFYHFTSQVSIRPGQTVKVVEVQTSYANGATDATLDERDLNGKQVGRVIIRSIEYADGSVWSPSIK